MAALPDPKQERFCQHYSRYGQTEAAVLFAGYDVKTRKETGSTSAAATASRLLKDVNVAARIRQIQDKRARRADVSIEYVLTNLKAVVKRSMQEIKPVFDAQGLPTGEYQYDSKGAVGALKLIGEYLGMYTDKMIPTTPAGSGNTYNTQVNVYIPENNRVRVIEHGVSSDGSQGQGSPPRQIESREGTSGTSGPGKLGLPTNGTS